MEVDENTPDNPLGVVAMATHKEGPLEKIAAREAWWCMGKTKLDNWAKYLGVRLQAG